MATILPAILPAFDKVRGVWGSLGLRPLSVLEVKRSWTGARPGLGTKTTTTRALLCNGQNPLVEQANAQDVVAGLYQSGDVRVGPLTPAFSGGGHTIDQLDPPQDGTTFETFYVVTGPGQGASGRTYSKISEDVDSATAYFLILRAADFSYP